MKKDQDTECWNIECEGLEEEKKNYKQIPVPEELRERVEQSMKQAKEDTNQKPKKKIIPYLARTGAGVAAAMLVLTLLANMSASVAMAMENIPVIGVIAKVVTFRNYGNTKEDGSMEAKVKTPQVELTDTENGTEYQKTQDQLNQTIQDYTNEIIAQYEADVAAVSTEEMTTEALTNHESVNTDYEVVTDNDSLYSLRMNTTIAMGGSDSYSKIYHVDKKSGRLIGLKDLFTDGADYMGVISDNIKAQMREQMKADENKVYFLDDDEPEWDFKQIKADQNFYVNADGKLVLVFDKYEVAPGYMGMVEFTIPTDVVSDIVKDGYLK